MATTIELLQKQLREISSLRDLESAKNPNFEKWNQLTIAILEKRLDKEKADGFPSFYKFWPNHIGPWDEFELKETLNGGLSSAEAYLQGLIEEIEIFGEDGNNQTQPSQIPGNTKDSRFGNVSISGGTVVFGDGAKITQVAVKELIDALSKEIEEKVPEGEEKRSVLNTLKTITTNETFASVAGTVIGEILRRVVRP